MKLPYLRVLALSLCLVAPWVAAQDFKIGMAGAPSAMDPHASNALSNVLVHNHMFEQLIAVDPDNRLVPKLAEAWKAIDPLNWEFKLRKGVKFHDGSIMTADDVAYSLNRVKAYKVGAFADNVSNYAAIKIVDATTLRITTREPNPELPYSLAGIFIMSKKASAAFKPADLDSGKGMVGTAPFKFVRFQRDDRLDLARHDAYWGAKPAFSTVTLRFIDSPATRLAALLAGDVQAIEKVPAPDLVKLRVNPAYSVFSKTSSRLFFLAPDQMRTVTPFVSGKDGKPLAKNPLQDLRVRQALSMAIGRDLIRDRVMEGLADPTLNLSPSLTEGYNPALAVPRYDPAGAKKLLAQAGYPDGFALTLHAAGDRNPALAIAIAGMWSRIGVTTKVDSAPSTLFYSRGFNHAYSMSLLSLGADAGLMSQMVGGLLMCPDTKTGAGAMNFGRYCNPKLDAIATKASKTQDDKARLALYKEAGAAGINDLGIIPLHHSVSSWAMIKGYTYQGYADESTYAFAFSKK